MELNLIAILIAALAALIGGLILWNLRMLREAIGLSSGRMDKQEDKVEGMQEGASSIRQEFAVCKADCDREFATKEEYVRSESYTRTKLDQVLNTVARMEGALKISEKMPEIVGQVVREVVRELHTGEKNHGQKS